MFDRCVETLAATGSMKSALASLLSEPAYQRAARATTAMQHGEGLEREILKVLRAFQDAEVEFLPNQSTGTLRLGRDLGVDVQVTDPSVSKVHATLRWDARGYRLEDEGSTNGTYVNAERVQGARELLDGDTVSLGDAQLLFVTAATLLMQLESMTTQK